MDHAVHHLHLAIQARRNSPSQKYAWQRHDRRPHGQRFIAAVAPAKMKRIQHHIAFMQKTEILRVCDCRNKQDLTADASERFFPATLQPDRPFRNASFDHDQHPVGISLKYSPQHNVIIRMKLEQRLRACIQMSVIRQPESFANRSRIRRNQRAFIVGPGQRHADQLFGVVILG